MFIIIVIELFGTLVIVEIQDINYKFESTLILITYIANKNNILAKHNIWIQ